MIDEDKEMTDLDFWRDVVLAERLQAGKRPYALEVFTPSQATATPRNGVGGSEERSSTGPTHARPSISDQGKRKCPGPGAATLAESTDARKPARKRRRACTPSSPPLDNDAEDDEEDLPWLSSSPETSNSAQTPATTARAASGGMTPSLRYRGVSVKAREIAFQPADERTPQTGLPEDAATDSEGPLFM